MSKKLVTKPSAFGYTFSAKEFTDLREEGADSLSVSQAHEESVSHEEDVLPPPTSTAAVRSALSGTRFATYLQDFDSEAIRESRVFCSVPASLVDDSARAQLLAAGIEKEDDELQHRNELDHIDFLKRNRILELEKQRQARRADQLHNLRSIDRQRQQTSELVETYYDHARLELDIHLTSRQGEVSQHIGEIRKFRRGDYDPDKPDWKQFEQQVQIRVCKIRGIKDKVPEGNYIVLVSKWEKMGGTPHAWSNRGVNDEQPPTCPLHQDTTLPERKRCEVCNGWAGATAPMFHDGKPRTYEMEFDTRLFTFFQPQTRVKPYNCLMFELVRLVDKNRKIRANESDDVLRPKVVGWGVIPIVDSKFAVINGKFRFPMLRGPYKPTYGHYKTVQEDIVDDLENWLGNIYVDIYPYPREHFGRSEFTLQTDFSNKLLNLNKYPSSKDPDGWPYDTRKRGLSMDMSKDMDQKLTIMGKTVVVDTLFQEEEFPYHRPPYVEEKDTPALTRWGLLRTAVLNLSKQKRQEELKVQKEAISALEQGKVFRYSIHPYGATLLESTWRIQVEYCVRAIKDELNLREPWTFKFWLVVVVFFTSLYVQLYIHSVFVYCAVVAAGIPVDSADPTWYGIHVAYIHRQTYPLDELFVVFFSMISMYFVQLFEISLGWLFKFGAGTIPEQLSKFVFTTSLSAMLIPFTEIALDVGLGLRRSDWNRLWDFMDQHQYGQYYTFIIFALIYSFLFAGSFVSTFLYTMALHLNGILQDSYWRILVVNEETCHIPDDLEVSIPELQYILHKAEQWRGLNGQRRKTTVHRLTTTDEHDPEYQRYDVHVQICELNCGSVARWKSLEEYTIYREFFITEEGAILEVVGGENHPHGVSFMMNNLAKKLKLTGFGGNETTTNAGELLAALFGGGHSAEKKGGAAGGGAAAAFFDAAPKKERRVGVQFA